MVDLTSTQARGAWQNRIIGHGEEAPDQLLANPLNFRIHSKIQQDAMAGVLDQIGWIDEVKVNQRSGHVINGHMRIGIALSRNEPSVPVTYLDLDEHEERLALATYDPIGAMAGQDAEQLDALLREVSTGDAAVQAMLSDLAESAGITSGADPDSNRVESGSALFSHEQIIEAALSHFRARGFPYRNLPVHVCMQEINKLAQTDPDSLVNTDTAYHVADTYHPHRFHAAAEQAKSPLQAFGDDNLLRRTLRLILDNGQSIGDIIGKLSIVSGTQACSNFRPGFACYLYRRFCQPGATVLDTSTGYGGRLVGFMASGLGGRYIGIDPNAPTHDGNLRMAADLGFSDRVELHNLPAEDVDPDILRGRCDFAFTSPPYFAKEHYSDDDTQSWVRYRTGEAWRDGFLLPMLALQSAALKPGAHAVVNIADVPVRGRRYPLAEWTKDAAEVAGLAYVGTEDFSLTNRFGAGQDDEVATEPVLVFKKAA